MFFDLACFLWPMENVQHGKQEGQLCGLEKQQLKPGKTGASEGMQ